MKGNTPISWSFYMISIPDSVIIGGETNIELSRINVAHSLGNDHGKGSEPVIVTLGVIASHCYTCFFGLAAVAMRRTSDARNINLPDEVQ